MASRPADLPEFANPPLHEVVLGLQFKTDRPLTAVDPGLYWERIRTEYPVLQEARPLGPISVEGGGEQASRGELRFSQLPPLRRCWFVGPDENHLVQLDSMRYLANWRKMRSGDAYPRFEQIYDKFVRQWQGFGAFCEDRELGTPIVTHGEMTYVNVIEPGSLWSSAADWGRVVPLLGTSCRGTDELVMERLEYTTSFEIPDSNSQLQVKLEPAYRHSDMEMVLRFSLTINGRITADLTDWMLSARETIVRSFERFTTVEAHQAWGLKT